jgi:hypothetical protein
MATNPRISSAIPGQQPHFVSVLSHQPAILATFSRLYGTFWSRGVVDHRTKEVARIRNARVTDCRF